MRSPPATRPARPASTAAPSAVPRLCQVAVTLAYATSRGHALIGRALYLPEGCAADEEHRELAGVPQEVMFATKPQLTGSLLDRAQSLGIRAAFVAGDEVYGGRELRRGIRQRGMGYAMAVRANHADDHFVPCTGAKPVAKGWNNKRGKAERGRADTVREAEREIWGLGQVRTGVPPGEADRASCAIVSAVIA
jgi:SRSO17 transposase